MIWLIGSKGMLGSDVAKLLTQNKMPWIGTNSEIDISDYDAIEHFEKTIETSSYFPSELTRAQRKIQWIINCAAYTNVDQAEEDSEICRKVNTTGPQNLARLCRNIGAKLIHISTDYVFDGKASVPYTEEAATDPSGIYGKTKLDGENAIENLMNTYYIIRTSWLYGKNGKNFVNTMIDLMNTKEEIKVVNDQKGTPTFTEDLAQVILKFIEKNDGATSLFGKKSPPNYGVYHFTNAGDCTWYDFARLIQKYGKKDGLIKGDCVINACSSEEYPTPAVRPAYSVLNKDKITKALKIKIPAWENGLERMLKENKD